VKGTMDIEGYVKKRAKRHGWSLRLNSEFTQNILQGLQANLDNYGCLLCPCRDSWGEKGKDQDILCPCHYAAADIKEFGHCYCGLFLSKEFAASQEEPEGIPDRRPDSKYP